MDNGHATTNTIHKIDAKMNLLCSGNSIKRLHFLNWTYIVTIIKISKKRQILITLSCKDSSSSPSASDNWTISFFFACSFYIKVLFLLQTSSVPHSTNITIMGGGCDYFQNQPIWRDNLAKKSFTARIFTMVVTFLKIKVELLRNGG